MGDFEVDLTGLDAAAAALGDRKDGADATRSEITAAHRAFTTAGAPGLSRLAALAGAEGQAPLAPMEKAIDAMFDGLADLQFKAVYELAVAQETLTEIRRLYAAADGQ